MTTLTTAALYHADDGCAAGGRAHARRLGKDSADLRCLFGLYTCLLMGAANRWRVVKEIRRKAGIKAHVKAHLAHRRFPKASSAEDPRPGWPRAEELERS